MGLMGHRGDGEEHVQKHHFSAPLRLPAQAAVGARARVRLESRAVSPSARAVSP
jgi:hypothetical protein